MVNFSADSPSTTIVSSSTSTGKYIQVNFDELNLNDDEHKIVTRFIETQFEGTNKIKKNHCYVYVDKESGHKYSLNFSHSVEVLPDLLNSSSNKDSRKNISYVVISKNIVGKGGEGYVKKAKIFFQINQNKMVFSEIFENKSWVRKKITVQNKNDQHVIVSIMIKYGAKLFGEIYGCNIYYKEYQKKNLRYSYYVYMPFIEGIDLNHIVEDKNYRNIAFLEKLQILLACCVAVKNFHSIHQHVHYDIKPHNIIYNFNTQKAHLIDFSSVLQPGVSVTLYRGTPGYSHPALKVKNNKANIPVSCIHDIYSLIKTLECILFQCYPEFTDEELKKTSQESVIAKALENIFRDRSIADENKLQKMIDYLSLILDKVLELYGKDNIELLDITSDFIKNYEYILGHRQIYDIIKKCLLREANDKELPESLEAFGIFYKIRDGSIPISLLKSYKVEDIQKQLSGYFNLPKIHDLPEIESRNVFFEKTLENRLIKNMLFLNFKDFQESTLESRLKFAKELKEKEVFKEIQKKILLPIEKELHRLYYSINGQEKHSVYSHYVDELYKYILQYSLYTELDKTIYYGINQRLNQIADTLTNREPFSAFLRGLAGVLIAACSGFTLLASSNFRHTFFCNKASAQLYQIVHDVKVDCLPKL